MKQILMKTLAAVIMIGAAIGAEAQELRASYFMKSSLYRHQLNPAMLEQTYFSVPLLGNVNVHTTGNVGLDNFVYKLDGNKDYDLTTFMSPTVSADQFLNGLSDNNKGNAHVNYTIFSMAFNAFQGVNLVEVNVRSNTMLNMPYELFEFMKKTGEKEKYSFENLGGRTQNYVELALGHSHVINEKLTVGAKVKFLLGVAYADLKVNRMDLTLNDDQWIIDADAELSAAVLDSKFKYADPDDKTTKPGQKKVNGIDDISFGLPGFGMAIDLGATYKVMDGLTVSGSVTDLGFISWSKTNKALSQDTYVFDGFTNISVGETDTGNKDLGEQFEALEEDLEKMFSFYDEGQGSTTSSLAATINLGGEYEMPFYRKLSAGLLYTGRFQGKYSWNQAMLSANVRPLNWFEASLNTSYSTFGWGVGGVLDFHTKGFNFFIGTDCILGKVSKEFIPMNNMNANISFGFNIPMNIGASVK